uniref:PTP-2 n=1 Tax=Spodoptera frugiperda nuclear polyhedrosis virus TaxID=10455 RepID=A0A7G3W7M6_NPVSF|nr:PTP-2 [Spodoptera frugiperda multiple nucleopolyhedrovirus]
MDNSSDSNNNFLRLSNGNLVNVTQILNNLYLGGIIYNWDDFKVFVEDKNINAIVSIWDDSMINVTNLGLLPEDYLYVYIHDNQSANIMQYFDLLYNFIKRKMDEGKNVYVHCHAGISRSATIVVYFIMKYCEISLSEAYQLVLDKREIRPNQSFLLQLHMAESQMEF